MSTILVEETGVQVLPPSRDSHQTINSWTASQVISADQRTKHAAYADLAARLYVKKASDK